MKPVVSSIVALAIAIAPFTAMASPEKTVHKPAIAKVMKHSHHKKVEKTEEKVAKATKSEKSEKSDNSEDGESASIVRVRHTSK
jgi:hypothetical protein